MNKKLIPLFIAIPIVIGVAVPLGIVLGNKENKDNQADDEHTHSYVMKYDNEGHWEECECGDKKEKISHNLVLTQTTPSTCSVSEEFVYKCSDCDYTKTTHGNTREHHTYKTTILKDANCVEKGVKHIECEKCHESLNVLYEAPNAHMWNSGVLQSDGSTLFTCEKPQCNVTYSALDFSSSTSTSVDSAKLMEVGCVKLKEATIELDSATLSGLNGNVSIGVDKMNTSEIISTIDDVETKELLADRPVFNFSITEGGESVHSFSGKVKVDIPYELKDGENPDDISIAYIPSNGSDLEFISGKYEGGMVSFETDHFSMYAIIKLPTEEACQKFGHNLIKTKTENSSCVEHGHDIYCCTRCGEQILEELPLIEHNYQFVGSVQSTATEHGYIEKKCSVCGDIAHEELPLLPNNNDSYALTFFKSLLNSNIELNLDLLDYEDNYHDVFKIVFAPNSENPFCYLKECEDGDSREYGEIYYGSKRYSFSNANIRDNDFIENTVKSINEFNSASSHFEECSNFIYDLLMRVVFKKTTKDGFDVYTIDYDNLRSIIQACKTDNAQQFIDRIFGEGFYDKTYNFVRDFFDRTIEESLKYLKDEGYDFKEMMNFLSSVSFDEIPTYDDFFDDDRLQMKGAAFLRDVFGSEDVEDFDTFEEVEKIINKYKDLTPVEIANKFVDEEDQFDYCAFANHVIDFAEKNLTFEMKLTTSGQFVSIDGDVKTTKNLLGDYIDEDIDDYKMVFSAKTNINLEKEFKEVKANIDKSVEVNEKLDFNSDTNKDFIKSYLKSLYGVEFEYFEGDENGNRFFESKEALPSLTKEMANLSSQDEYDRYSSKMRIYVNKYYYNENFTIYRYNDLHNVYGMKDSNNVYYYTLSLQPYEIRWDVNNKSSETIEKDKSYEILVSYDYDNGSMRMLRMQDHYYDYTKCSKDEYLKENSRYYYDDDYFNNPNFTFYKGVCCDCGEIYYTYGYDRPYQENTLISGKMNEEALKYEIAISNNDNYSSSYFLTSDYDYNSGKRKYIYCQDYYDVSSSKICSGLNKKLSHIYFGDDQFKDVIYNFGNVEISYTYKQGYNSCDINEFVIIKIDGTVYKSFVNKCHLVDRVVDQTVTNNIDSCNYSEVLYLKCPDCGKVVYQRTYYYTNHDFIITNEEYDVDGCIHYYHEKYVCSKCGYEKSNDYRTSDHDYHFIERVYSGVLFESFDVYKCDKCGDIYCTNFKCDDYHHVTYNDEYLYYCDDCDQDYLMRYHYYFECLNPDYYYFSNYYYSYDSDSVYYIGVRDLTSSWSTGVYNDSSWLCYYGLLSKDDESNYVIGDNCTSYNFQNQGYACADRNYGNYYYEESCAYLIFDKNTVDAYLQNAKEGEELYLFFVHKYEDTGETIIQAYKFPTVLY